MKSNGVNKKILNLQEEIHILDEINFYPLQYYLVEEKRHHLIGEIYQLDTEILQWNDGQHPFLDQMNTQQPTNARRIEEVTNVPQQRSISPYRMLIANQLSDDCVLVLSASMKRTFTGDFV